MHRPPRRWKIRLTVGVDGSPRRDEQQRARRDARDEVDVRPRAFAGQHRAYNGEAAELREGGPGGAPGLGITNCAHGTFGHGCAHVPAVRRDPEGNFAAQGQAQQPDPRRVDIGARGQPLGGGVDVVVELPRRACRAPVAFAVPAQIGQEDPVAMTFRR